MISKLNFQNKTGQTLFARLELPLDRHPIAFALFAHCFTCNKNLAAVRNISRALTQNGFGVMRFDFTGLGESEGDFSKTNFSSNVQDLIAASEALSENYEAPKLLIGHSLGGAAVIFAGAQIPSVEAIATIGAPASPDHVQHLFEDSLEEIQKNQFAKVNIGGRPFTIEKQFVDDLISNKMADVIKRLRKAIAIFHAPQDKIVGIENAAKLYKDAMHPKSFISLDGADHLLSNKEDSIYAGDVIANWAKRYLSIKSPEQPLKSNQQVVVRLGQDKFTTDIVAGRHAFRADEPVAVGGNDYGPSPYDLLLASLGACTVMTLRMYVNRKKWDVEEMVVHLSHNKDYAKDCEDCEASDTKIDHIYKYISIKGNVDAKQKARMLEIADRCPVHKTLHNPLKVVTKLQA